jgi:hypothetical protein
VRTHWLRRRVGVLGERNFRRFYVAFATSLLRSSMSTALAVVLGSALVFGIGAVYGILSSAVVLAIPSVRAVRWLDQDSASAPEQARRRG